MIRNFKSGEIYNCRWCGCIINKSLEICFYRANEHDVWVAIVDPRQNSPFDFCDVKDRRSEYRLHLNFEKKYGIIHHITPNNITFVLQNYPNNVNQLIEKA